MTSPAGIAVDKLCSRLLLPPTIINRNDMTMNNNEQLPIDLSKYFQP